MKECIKIIDLNGKYFVKAKDLHKALGVKKGFFDIHNGFHDWYLRIDKSGYVFGKDFGFNPNQNVGYRETADRIFSVKMAIEISNRQKSKEGYLIATYLATKTNGTIKINI